MASANRTPETASSRKIEYLSPPAEVSMSDGYFELASLDHFWVRRRFEVFRMLAGGLIVGAREIAEFGCGHGILQRQIEQQYGREVTGFDLNEKGLKHNLSQFSKVCCYDIHEMLEPLRAQFDLIFLWDVLEHITDEDKFLEAILFHMAPEGKLIVNVPAGEWAFSGYDRAAGHIRRYLIHHLRKIAERNQLELKEWTYWGLPLVPVLLVRKLSLCGKADLGKVYSAGFDSRSTAINSALGALSRCEWIPQKILGTSLMAILRINKNRETKMFSGN
jgi:SAM-dependent methyltransferase